MSLTSMPFVSIIMPCYNASRYICQAIDSILQQTYKEWELLVIDDCSTDKSAEIIKSYCRRDNRIHFYTTLANSRGAAIPRNIGIENAKGRIIAFLDSLWFPDKLENQLPWFDHEKTAIVYSNYEKMNEDGERSNRIVVTSNYVNYIGLLKGNIWGNLTAAYDTQKTGKIYQQDVGHEDYVLWLAILKQGYIAKNTNTVAGLYRIQKGSLSGNKIKSAKWTWQIYRHIERLGIFKSLFYFSNYCFRSGVKFLK